MQPSAASRLTVPERGQVRLEIARSAIGRIKVAVVPEGVASRAGGVAEFANDVARGYGVRGTLIVVAGGDYWAITSYPQSHAAAAALQTAVERRDDDRLVAELARRHPADRAYRPRTGGTGRGTDLGSGRR